jgi:ATP-dependent DNA helicase RecQ
MTATGIIAAMAMSAGDDTLLAALQRQFGHPAFRSGQRDVVEAVQSGSDCVVVMPTGGGKSLCYQLPAVLDEAPTVVVSPLIALMKDQVDGLVARGLAAAALHSNLDTAGQRRVEAGYAAGHVRLLYVAPERLTRRDLRALLLARRPRRIVVDEAHCISEWGHDFRRDYLRIGDVADALRPVQLVACTATATPTVRDDIAARLGMQTPQVFVHGFARPSLYLAVERVRDEAEKLARLDDLIDPGDGHAIVYAGTRARAASVAERLGRRGPTMLYHADLGPAERTRAQERFAAGEVRVAVATSAFGMGVDVATVRQVVHLALPASFEEYYQQAGRAGRDGLPARCVVIYGPGDRRLPEFFIEAAHPDARVLAGVVRSLRSQGADPGAWRLIQARHPSVTGLSDAAGDAAREILRDAGVIVTDGRIVEVDADRLPVDHGRIAAHRRVAYERFARLVDYLGATRCRHRAILDHFGETGGEDRCGDACDVCAPPIRAAQATADGVVVRKALSAVARLNGRFGLTRVAAVLAGSRRRAVAEMPGLSDLPTFAALGEWREADVVELLRTLVDAGAIRQGPPPMPTVALTPRGLAAMRGGLELSVPDPRAGRKAQAGARENPTAPTLDPAATAVLERLRTWRTGMARARSWPAYMVFNDRTLQAIAASRPTSRAQLLAVPGVGPGKLALYADDVLGLIADGVSAPTPAGAEDLLVMAERAGG